MTLDEYNGFCGAHPHATYVVQWEGAHVWKIGGKMFAICWAGAGEDDEISVTFKVSDIAYEVLREQPGLRPAPYLASRGMKWIQHYEKPGLDDDSLKAHLSDSYRIVSLGLTKKLQRELGLNQA